MVAKKYIVSPESLAILDPESIEQHIKDEPHCLFGFSPDTLRQLCSTSKKMLYLLDQCFSSRFVLASDSPDALFERPGYDRPMSDREWFGKMQAICKDCLIGDAVPTDPDETGFAAYELQVATHRAERDARLKAKQDAAKASLAAKRATMVEHRKTVEADVSSPAGYVTAEVDEPGKLVKQNATGKQNKHDADETGEQIFFQTQFYGEQLNISNLITGSRLVSIGTDTRKRWESNRPLVVTKISGIETGTTTIQYVGEELHVGDIETWATAIQFGAKSPLESRVPLVESDMLKALHRGDGGPYYKTLREQLRRLQDAKLILLTTHRSTIAAVAAMMPEDGGVQDALASGRLEIVIPLLGGSSNGSKEGRRGTIHVTIPKDVRALFGKGLSSWFKADGYYKLRSPTARRLFLLYGRHKDPWPFTKDELREYLGSTMEREGDFTKKLLEPAFRELVNTGYFACTPSYVPSARRHGVEAYAVTFGALKLKNYEPNTVRKTLSVLPGPIQRRGRSQDKKKSD